MQKRWVCPCHWEVFFETHYCNHALLQCSCLMQGKATTTASSSFSIEHPPGNGHAGPSGNGHSGRSAAQSQSARADSGSAQPLHTHLPQPRLPWKHVFLFALAWQLGGAEAFVSVCPCLAISRNSFFVSGHGSKTVFGILLPVWLVHNMTHLSWCLCSSLIVTRQSAKSGIGCVACNAGASASTSQSTPFASPPAQSSKRGVPPAAPLAQTALVGNPFPSWKCLPF